MLESGDLRYLLSLSRQQTLVGAGRELGVNQTTVGRRILALKSSLGTQLFNRIGQRWVPTEAGQIALQRAVRVEAEILGAAVEITARDQSLAGPVRLKSVSLVINNVLAPRVGDLLSKFPEIELELIGGQQNLNLTHLEADIALRLARPTLPSVVARRVGVINFPVYAARRHVKRAEVLPWIAYAESMDSIPEAQWLAKQLRGEKPIIRVNHNDVMMSLLAKVPGRTLLASARVNEQLDLVAISGAEPVLQREVWLVCLKARRDNPRIAAVAKWASLT